MNVSPGIIFISPALNKQKPWGCINYPQGSYFVIWNVNPPTILNVFFLLDNRYRISLYLFLFHWNLRISIPQSYATIDLMIGRNT